MTPGTPPPPRDLRRTVRIAASLGTAGALACLAAWALPSAPERPVTGHAREAYEALTLTCPGGDTNSASPDGGSGSLRPPLTQARAWARAGFAARFPEASPRAVDYDDGTVVLFREGDETLRAALLYSGTGRATSLTLEKYC